MPLARGQSCHLPADEKSLLEALSDSRGTGVHFAQVGRGLQIKATYQLCSRPTLKNPVSCSIVCVLDESSLNHRQSFAASTSFVIEVPKYRGHTTREGKGMDCQLINVTCPFI